MSAAQHSSMWDQLDRHKYRDERETVRELLAAQPFSAEQRARICAEAEALVRGARAASERKGVVESFLQEFSLGTREGLALMCLAEAVLRIPDADTRDKLIAEKIGSADWSSHLGQSDSLFVNASTWGLMLTGRLVDVDTQAKQNLGGFLAQLAGRIGEPVIRRAVGVAVRMMGEQFVLGRTIEDALRRAEKENVLGSFDMLGEGARTAGDAERYERIYAEAIAKVGAAAQNAGPERGHGVSVKLSALSPRYEAVQETRVWAELYPRVKRLTVLAAKHNLNLAIDAEEADRLVISLKLVDKLCAEPELQTWQGLGIVVQAYQKRGREVIAALADLAQRHKRRLMVRLVKGAYWDSEIKRAQVAGRPDYPVFTTKAATDLSYLVCAKALIAAHPHLYPQFATHNAHTLAAVRELAAAKKVPIEHQRLHGMGETLYAAAKARYGAITVRTYAPVGGHEDLLPYLVRRLLENGANTSFVHALLDERFAAEDVVRDPIAAVEAHADRHGRIPVPADLYGPARRNPLGRDFSMVTERARAAQVTHALKHEKLTAGPIVGGKMSTASLGLPVTSPAERGLTIGHVHEAAAADIEDAVRAGRRAQGGWDRLGGIGRAAVLRAMADALDAEIDRLVALLALEAGKTLNDGVSEVREAVDFCRYYAHLAEKQFAVSETLTGPTGEVNKLQLQGRGVFVCISPWNFPLAIFTGQIAAALAAGNAVLAKPAEQTPLIAAEAVKLFHKAGLPVDVLALLPGTGENVGAKLVSHTGIDGVAFTGGTDTARRINQALAVRPGPIVPFIAETGGLNGMFIDTSALKEQVVDDVILSAFGSAGQRCSALRVLFVPHELADEIIATLKGALDAVVLGDPGDPATDVGPVIDEEALAALNKHVSRLEREAKILTQRDMGRLQNTGSFFGPVIAEIPTPDYLEREVFGPILHVHRYDPEKLEKTAQAFAARGYGLTLGIHSRIDRFAHEVQALVPAGNVYVNRSMTGAVVGVQPFGGQGLSGTGPKAGGPHALSRFMTERSVSVNIAAQGGDPALLNL
ncbi:MAG: bifunctional proline dehydrogenase/L-glutamate gamma-semialdehyde dehydrogenase PutA [Rhodospirillaceae bacterium]|nr:bifunctional proline dehydrogenase/L-glutamate gamma-semialdehyde dehydrogenase PutA [Rhodospirillaceae bacterium]